MPRRKYKALVLVLYAVLLLSVSGFLLRLFEYRQAVSEYDQIALAMTSTDTLAPMDTREPEISPAMMGPTRTISPASTPAVYVSQQMRSLKAQNRDTVGYLEIVGTAIGYPVVKGRDNSYYESHTFSKKKNASGAIFMDSTNDADLSDFNLVLYGHNMKDGSMFHELLQYRKTAFTRDHRNIVLTGLYEQKTFYVFSAYTIMKSAEIRGFKYNTAEEKQSFLNVLVKRSEISAGSATLTADSQIITLVTCRGNREKDFFVVHGVLVD